MELRAVDIRVLGCLVEKEATTPDNYPLSTNALVNACNQTTNREPVMSLSEREVDAVLLELREQGLARTVRGDGQRVHKHKHVLGEAWQLDRTALAVLSVLMLRGAQTTAELRARTERYGVALDGAGTESVLEALAARPEPLVRLLPRRPGERESRWLHLVGEVAEPLPDVAVEPGRAAEPGGTARQSSTARIEALEHALESLHAEVVEQRGQIAHLAERLDRLARDLGTE